MLSSNPAVKPCSVLLPFEFATVLLFCVVVFYHLPFNQNVAGLCHVIETSETAVWRNGPWGHRLGPQLGVTEASRPCVCEYTPARSPCEVCTAVSAVEIFLLLAVQAVSSREWRTSSPHSFLCLAIRKLATHYVKTQQNFVFATL